MPLSRLLNRVLLLVYLLLQIYNTSISQVKNIGQVFNTVSVPRKTGYTRQSLDQELVNLSNKEEVRALLKANKKLRDVSLTFDVRLSNGVKYYWRVNANGGTDLQDDFLITRSKNIASSRIFKLSDFATLLKDTIVLLDTLKIEMFLKDDAYPPDAFILEYKCGKKIKKFQIPFTNSYLLLPPAIITDCKNVGEIKLYNSLNVYRTITRFRIIFLDEFQKEDLLCFAQYQKIADPDLPFKDLLYRVATYSTRLYGAANLLQLNNWLTSELNDK